MAWTSPRTFVNGETETASIFNTHLRDNLIALGAMYGLKQRVLSSVETSAFSGTSSSYADITNLTLSITTTGGRLVIYEEADPSATDPYEAVANTSGGLQLVCYLQAFVGANSAGVRRTSAIATISKEIPRWQWSYTPVAGTYTVKIQYKITSTVNAYQSDKQFLVAEEWGLVSA